MTATTAEERLQHALDLAYRYLGRRDRTVLEVRRHLEGKRVEPSAIDATLASLAEAGYLDDARYARRFTEDRRELDDWGADRIARRLQAVGVGGAEIEDALNARDADSERDAAIALLRRRLRVPPQSDRERDRALGMLVRKGYDLDLAYDVVRAFEREPEGGVMLAARVHGYEDHKLHLDEVPEPEIQSPLDVIVRIGGAGVCRTDLHVLDGMWDFASPGLPFIVGHENAGWVHEVGSAVTSVAVGDTVIAHSFVTCGLCRPCRRGDDAHCERAYNPGLSADGGFAEYMRTGERALLKVDPSLQPSDIAGLTDAGLTAYHAVRRAAKLLEPGHKVVAIGAGGLGLIGVQLLRALTAAEVIVVEPRETSRALAAEVGAHHTVAADGTQVQQVLDLTDGRGAEVVLDFVGEFGTPADGVAMTRRAGAYFVVGYGGSLEISTLEIITKELLIVGNAAGTYDDLADLATLTAQGAVTLHTTPYPLAAVNDALHDLEQGRVQGRAVLVPG